MEVRRPKQASQFPTLDRKAIKVNSHPNIGSVL